MFDVSEIGEDNEQVSWPGAHNLVGDVAVPAACVSHFGLHHVKIVTTVAREHP